MKQRFLSKRLVISKAFQKVVVKLVPLYKVRLYSETAETDETRENSSPVCYANIKGLREEFQNT
ncbi:hypothetical protein [Pontibacter cellulosilyticus]|uniref:Uncharacterized protein n=1 Tax=Pontibacter cellulosilyticus TaxID=1720253 RepID=A0A923N4B5_9BACT|nr:hypothetical protein [Pontibacter cellulosilyticus]MBC5992278.1 hypothetical protein [Pontibacter cellulosilyticus]